MPEIRNILIKFVRIIGLLLIIFASLLYVIIDMPGDGKIDQLKELSEKQFHMSERMKEHVVVLADKIGERHYNHPKKYNEAADYIEQAFEKNGLVPYSEEYGEKVTYRNIIAELYGVEAPDEIIIIGAHYDTIHMSPGADDNASGVAVMLELAKQLNGTPLKRSIRFIAFANEESPHFLRKSMGSLYHAKRIHQREEQILAMLSLEMLGYYSNEPGSQRYPKPFNYFYPDKGNFVAFVSNIASRDLLRNSIRYFRESGEFPSEGMTAPVALVPDVRRSDQAAFWRYSYPAIMITDTAAYRNYNYHQISDIPETLDYESMARVTSGLMHVLESLAGKIRE